MSEPIKTERYRLALIAHHAEKLAELLCDGKSYEESTISLAHRFSISVCGLESLAKYINYQPIKEETK